MRLRKQRVEEDLDGFYIRRRDVPMKIERVAQTLLGVAGICWLFVSAGCNGGLSSGNGADSSGQSGDTPTESVQGPGDWGASMLAGGKVGIGMFPAKFSFDVTAAPSCANDYVAFNTSLAGVSPTTAASRGGNTFKLNALSTPAGIFTIKQGATTLALTAAASNSATTFAVVANTAGGIISNAASLAAQITALGGPVGVTASNSGTATVTVTALNKGIGGNSITLASTLTAADFTFGGSPLAGGVGRGNIVAFNQLYTSQSGSLPAGMCGSNGPSVDWAYFTGTGTAVTSVVLSLDGTKVAFVENVGGTQAWLRILQWKAGEGAGVGYPSVPTSTLTNGVSWATGCPPGPSCLSSIIFSVPVATDTRSAPFYNYSTDTLYVGDNNGHVHKFTGVFLGTPAEDTAAPWPIPVHTGFILTSPVFDGISGNMFVGDSSGRLSYIREVGSGVGACGVGSPPCLGSTTVAVGPGGAIVDAPIVDGATGLLIAVNGTDTNSHGTIVQANTALAVASVVSKSIGGTTAPGSPIYSGFFDNTYLTSAIPNIAGHMYVCGKDSGQGNIPYIYQLSFAAATGILSGVGTSTWPAGTGFASASGEACSPVTEFFNPNGGGSGVARDWIFFSVGNLANSAATNNPIPAGACRTNNKGCILSIDVTGNPTWPPTLPTALIVAAPTPANNAGSTGGIIVDNTSISAQASSFYFSLGANSTGAGPGVPSCNTTAGVGCAVKLTQSGLD